MEIEIKTSRPILPQYKKEMEDYLWWLLERETMKACMNFSNLSDLPIILRRVVGKIKRDRYQNLH